MTTYRNLWTVVATTVGAIGLIAAYRTLTPLGVIETGLACGLLGWTTAWSWLSDFGPIPAKRLAAISAWTAVISVAFFGVVIAFGGWALVVLPPLVLGSPQLIGWVRSRRTRQTTDRAAEQARPEHPDDQLPRLPEDPLAAPTYADVVPGTVDPPASPLRDLPAPDAMTDNELCAAWRKSYVALERCSSTVGRSELVELRQGYLDELATRYPEAFAAWLASGARAAGDPSRFLGREHHRSRRKHHS